MKNKKIIMYSGIIILILFIVGIGILVINNHKKEENIIIEEYTPQEEITDEQLRQTNVTLYFYDDSINDLATEIIKIDSKKLLEKPEKQLIEFLIEGPKDENLTKLIPENTKLLNTEIKKDNNNTPQTKDESIQVQPEKTEQEVVKEEKTVTIGEEYKTNDTMINTIKNVINSNQSEDMKLYGYNIVIDSSIVEDTSQFTYTKQRVIDKIKYKFGTIKIYARDYYNNGQFICTQCYII